MYKGPSHEETIRHRHQQEEKPRFNLLESSVAQGITIMLGIIGVITFSSTMMTDFRTMKANIDNNSEDIKVLKANDLDKTLRLQRIEDQLGIPQVKGVATESANLTK